MIYSKIIINNYEVEITNNHEFESLRNQWISVQKDQNIPFFLTWSWISCWIKTYNPEIVVVSAKWNNKTVAIGLFTRSIDYRHGFIKSHQYRLHQMGDLLLDQIWMEYNDFISCGEHRVTAVNACLIAMQNNLSEWDEIILSMMEASRAREIQSVVINSHTLLTVPSYTINLVGATGKIDYLSSLTSNTRYQINRSIRIYNKIHGEVSLTQASCTQEALDLFREAGEYHKSRWPDSGYNNPRFIQFHENLINKYFDQHGVELIKVTSGDEVIGILYFHIVDKRVYFYLHGLRYEEDSKLKPGLVSHALATQYYLDRGMQKYDFMGGYSQYKCQLATESENMVSLCIQRPQLKFSIENIARKLKRLVNRNIEKEGFIQ